MVVPKQGEAYDTEKLHQKLQEIKTRYADKSDLTVASEDNIQYKNIIQAMDVALSEGFDEIQLHDASAAL